MIEQALRGIEAVLFVIGALLPMINPFGGAPIFLGLTAGCSPAERTLIARRVALYGFGLLIGSFFLGSHVLAFFGVSVPALRVAGGLVVMAAGWNLLNRGAEPATAGATTRWTPEELASRAFYPLTLPLTVGPGSISVAVTLGADISRYSTSPLFSAIVALVGMGLIALSIYLPYRFAERFSRLLGQTGIGILVRLSAFLLLCIGVEIAWKGASAMLTSLLKTTIPT
ncbi:MAG TPA: MarC family protein [Candidatus Dormibacteraeota bacterium]|nr:MarC family protein [Candidatus Dormibacteraeota bacterium]